MKNADSPAIPTITYDHGAAMQGLAVSVTDATGLTKREMMAMHMMCAMIAAPVGRVNIGDGEQLPLMAIAAADALLAELEKSQ